MSSKYGLLSFLIFCGVLVLAFKNYEIWTHPIELASEKSMGKKSEIKSEDKSEVPLAIGTQKDPFSNKSYVSISEKNIFSPERKDFPIVTVEKSNPATRPQVILYGVTIAGDYQSASLVNPGRPLRKGERETLTVKIGEKIGGYKLAKIMPDRIAMESSGDTFEVLLYDSKKPKKRMEARADTKPEMIASAQPAPVSPSGEVPMPAPAQESVKEPKAPVQTRVTASIPFNKYTYQLLGPSTVIGRGRILYTPTPGPSAQ